MLGVEGALHYRKENTAVNKLKNYKANLKEMSSSGCCIIYKILNNLVAARGLSYLQACQE